MERTLGNDPSGGVANRKIFCDEPGRRPLLELFSAALMAVSQRPTTAF